MRNDDKRIGLFHRTYKAVGQRFRVQRTEGFVEHSYISALQEGPRNEYTATLTW